MATISGCSRSLLLVRPAAVAAAGLGFAPIMAKPQLIRGKWIRCQAAGARGQSYAGDQYAASQYVTRKATLCLESELELYALAPREYSKQLTGRIRSCRTWQELQPLLTTCSACGDAINISSGMSQLSRLLRNKRLSSQQQSAVHSALAQLIDRSKGMMFDFDPQGLASLATAMARLDYMDEGFVQELMHHSRQRMYQFSPQALANFIWAVAKLDEQPYPLWLETYFDEVYIKLDRFNSQDIAQTLWGLCRLEVRPPRPLLEALCDRALEDMTTTPAATTSTSSSSSPPSGQAAATILTCLARLAYTPPDAWLAAFLAATQPALAQYLPMDLVSMVHALVTLNVAPGEAWMRQFYAVLKQRLIFNPTLSYSDFSRLMWALGRIDYVPDKGWLADFLAVSRPKLVHLRYRALAELIWALSCWGCSPDAAWLSSFLQAAKSRMSDFRPQYLAIMAIALARLGCQVPGEWLCCLLQQFQRRCGDAKAHDYVSLMEAVPLLHEGEQQQREQQLGQLATAAVSKFEVCDRGMLVRLAGSLADLQVFPGAEWVAAHQEAYARSVLVGDDEGVDELMQQRLQLAYDSWSKQAQEDLTSAA